MQQFVEKWVFVRMLVKFRECSDSMDRNRFQRIVYHWPAIVLVLGLLITLAWGGVVLWFFIRLLRLAW